MCHKDCTAEPACITVLCMCAHAAASSCCIRLGTSRCLPQTLKVHFLRPVHLLLTVHFLLTVHLLLTVHFLLKVHFLAENASSTKKAACMEPAIWFFMCNTQSKVLCCLTCLIVSIEQNLRASAEILVSPHLMQAEVVSVGVQSTIPSRPTASVENPTAKPMMVRF